MSEALRVRALEALGAFAPSLAREAIERGTLTLADATTWEGSQGTMRGRRVVLAVPDEIHVRILASPATADALTAAVAIAIATEDEVLADLVVETGPPDARRHPYR